MIGGGAKNEVGGEKSSRVRKGRGSGSNVPGRYVDAVSEYEDDGWNTEPDEESLDTVYLPDGTRKLITTNQSPDIPFSQSINPYKGCEHGCIYCFARPTHTYLDLSAGLDFETRIFYKTNAANLLRKELDRKAYECSVLAMGTNTDPYQPAEKSHRVMREILETLAACRHPVSIVTKGALILRDLDLLTELAEQNLVSVHVSVTTLSRELKTRLEPRTADPFARLRTIRRLSEAGVPTGAMVAPVIPFINDHEMDDIVAAVHDAGARDARYILLRLPLEVAPLFEEWLKNHYPLKADRVMSAVRSTRGGKTYQSGWHTRMRGQGEMANLIAARFAGARKKAGFDDVEDLELRTDLFVPPSGRDTQADLF